jgi:cadmium resistance protein CadD (predicted permease)
MSVHGFIPVLLASLASFVAANTDDLLTLVVFMAQVDSIHSRYCHVAIGQVIGFTLINLLCLGGIAFGKVIPAAYLGLLGLLPLFNGLWKLGKQITNKKRQRDSDDSDVGKEIEEIKLLVEYDKHIYENCPTRPLLVDQNHYSSSSSLSSYQNNIYNNLDNNQIDQNDIQVEEIKESAEQPRKESCVKKTLSKVIHCLRSVLHARVIEVVLVVVGDSGDSLTSSMPLFATESFSEILFTLAIFYISTAVLCFTAYLLVRCSLIARFMQKYGAWVRPLMLISLGIYLLSDSILWKLIINGKDHDKN